MFACLDVGYNDSAARAAAVTFERWEDDEARGEYSLDIEQIEPYVSGKFYRRELPCLMAVLEELPTRPDVVVIDGYVWLDDSGRKGLGGHLFEALGKTSAVVGVAKTRFATATDAVEVLRGSSERPLFVTAAGMDQEKAADCIRRMRGSDRIPTLLKWVDRLSRIQSASR